MVLFDKTGTLTAAQHVVTGVASATGNDAEILALAGAVESDSEHPLARAIVAATRGRGEPTESDGVQVDDGSRSRAVVNAPSPWAVPSCCRSEQRNCLERYVTGCSNGRDAELRCSS